MFLFLKRQAVSGQAMARAEPPGVGGGWGGERTIADTNLKLTRTYTFTNHSQTLNLTNPK